MIRPLLWLLWILKLSEHYGRPHYAWVWREPISGQYEYKTKLRGLADFTVSWSPQREDEGDISMNNYHGPIGNGGADFNSEHKT